MSVIGGIADPAARLPISPLSQSGQLTRRQPCYKLAFVDN